jgi:hypothetical protein
MFKLISKTTVGLLPLWLMHPAVNSDSLGLYRPSNLSILSWRQRAVAASTKLYKVWAQNSLIMGCRTLSWFTREQRCISCEFYSVSN